MHRMYVDLPSLCADLDRALGELIDTATRDTASWERGRAGKWTAGRHVAHVGVALARTADLFEQSESALRAGSLPPPPRRDLLQGLFIRVCVTGGYMPRGARTNDWMVPVEHPDREATVGSISRDAGRHRAVGERLGPDQRVGLWIASPFMAGWHYRLPEMVRMHAVHARHHRTLAEEAVRG